MRITFLGTGTSQGVPVIACSCAVCRSDHSKDKRLRSSVLIETQDKVLVIDTGPDFRQQMLREAVQQLDAVLFTHEHKDHIAGLDDIRAFNFKQGAVVPIYCAPRVQEALKREYHYAFSEQRYPGVPQMQIHPIGTQAFHIDTLEVIPIEVMHYKLPVWGFRIADFTYITDAKTIAKPEMDKIRGSKVLVLNALQKDKHISHLTLEEAIQLAQQLEVEQCYLTHVSHRMGLHAEISAELPEGIQLAYDGLHLEI